MLCDSKSIMIQADFTVALYLLHYAIAIDSSWKCKKTEVDSKLPTADDEW